MQVELASKSPPARDQVFILPGTSTGSASHKLNSSGCLLEQAERIARRTVPVKTRASFAILERKNRVRTSGSMKSIAFYLGLALLFTHELDSMPNHEWRVIPFLNSLADSTAELVFLLAHIPIFAAVIALIASLDRTVRSKARNFFCGFLVVHAVLHRVFSEDVAYEFSSWTSSVLIYGAGLCGVLYFAAASMERANNAA